MTLQFFSFLFISKAQLHRNIVGYHVMVRKGNRNKNYISTIETFFHQHIVELGLTNVSHPSSASENNNQFISLQYIKKIGPFPRTKKIIHINLDHKLLLAASYEFLLICRLYQVFKKSSIKRDLYTIKIIRLNLLFVKIIAQLSNKFSNIYLIDFVTSL